MTFLLYPELFDFVDTPDFFLRPNHTHRDLTQEMNHYQAC